MTLYWILSLIGAAFAGVLIGWFLHVRVCRRRVDELTDIWDRRQRTADSDRDAAQRQASKAMAQATAYASQIATLHEAHAQAEATRQATAEAERTALQSELDRLKRERASMQAEREAMEVASLSLQQESESLQTRLSELEARTLQTPGPALPNPTPRRAFTKAARDVVDHAGNLEEVPTSSAIIPNTPVPVLPPQISLGNLPDSAPAKPVLAESTPAPLLDASTPISELIGSDPTQETSSDVKSPKAAEIHTASEPTPEPTKPDNLRKIWGIGKKMEALLNGCGIHTFAQLADTSVEQLREWLDQYGSDRLKQIANEEVWPEQARLAAEGAWDQLEAYQKQLSWKKGGKPKGGASK